MSWRRPSASSSLLFMAPCRRKKSILGHPPSTLWLRRAARMAPNGKQGSSSGSRVSSSGRQRDQGKRDFKHEAIRPQPVHKPKTVRKQPRSERRSDVNMPNFAIPPASDEPLTPNSKFVGIWSNKRGWNDKGRYAMVIITEVSATGLARGYYVWGPPVKGSWTQDGSGYKWFAEYIVNDKFSIRTVPEIVAKLDDNVLALSTANADKPSEKSSIELRPIWQLARVHAEVEPRARREQASRRDAARRVTPADHNHRARLAGRRWKALSRLPEACKRLRPARGLRTKRSI